MSNACKPVVAGDRLRELPREGTKTERARDVRGALPARAQVVAAGVTGAAPVEGGSPENPFPGGELGCRARMAYYFARRL